MATLSELSDPSSDGSYCRQRGTLPALADECFCFLSAHLLSSMIGLLGAKDPSIRSLNALSFQDDWLAWRSSRSYRSCPPGVSTEPQRHCFPHVKTSSAPDFSKIPTLLENRSL